VKIILYTGRISWHRGVEEAVRSLRYLSRCSLIVLGFGPEQDISDLRELIRNEGLVDRVHLFDTVPFDEVSRYAMSADVGLVLHKNVCLNYYYVSPNKLFECMAAGLPMVASNFPDLKMYIEGYGLGVTCDPDSPKEIADAIEYILSDEKKYEEMRRNALKAAKIFTWENESKKILAIYEKLSNRKNP
jgi:glycosyltransferase involved in cell wall biosynthesis